MKAFHLKLPDEIIIEAERTICDGGTDLLIKRLLDDRHTGYLRIEADLYLGFALFKNGEILDGFLFKDGNIVSTSVKALIDFRILCEKDGKTWIVKVPEKYFDAAKIMHCGEVLIAPTDASVINFNAILKNYRSKIKKGLFILNTKSGRVALINIENSKWKLNMTKTDFDKLLLSEGTIVALYEFDDNRIKDNLGSNTPGDEIIEPEALVKRELISKLTEKYGEDIQPKTEKISREAINMDNLSLILKEVGNFIKFFIDDKGAGKFIEKLEKELGTML